MTKRVVVQTKKELKFETEKSKITYFNWGITFVTADDKSIMHFPWDNILYVEEIIS